MPTSHVILPECSNISPQDICSAVAGAKPGPNYVNKHYQVPTNFNIVHWKKYEHLFTESDPNLIDQIFYGFPVPYNHDSQPSVPFGNHKSANIHYDIVDEYILKNLEMGVLWGPFDVNPLPYDVTVSPMQVVFSASGKPRVVVDLSWGAPSVNDGISDDWTEFPGFDGDLRLPSVDSLVRIILSKRRPVTMWKADMASFYKQIITDPGDVHYLAISWRGRLYFDRSTPFGLRSAALSAQRIARAVCTIFVCDSNGDMFSITAYIDDYSGAEFIEDTPRAAALFNSVTDRLGVTRQLSKCVTGVFDMLWLGLGFNTEHFMLYIPEDKLLRAKEILQAWLQKDTCSRKDLQQLLGILNHLGAVIIPGRVFCARMLDIFRRAPFPVQLDEDFKLDVSAWLSFLQDPKFTGRSFMKSAFFSQLNAVLAIWVQQGRAAVRFRGDISVYTPVCTSEVTDELMYVAVVNYVATHAKFSVHDFVTFAVPTVKIECVINRAATTDKLIRKLLRNCCLAQAEGDFVIRAKQGDVDCELKHECMNSNALFPIVIM